MGRLMDWILNRDLEKAEKEMLTVLADGQGRAARAWKRVAERTHDPDAEKLAREAAMEEIRLTRMVNGMTDVYSYGRGSDG